MRISQKIITCLFLVALMPVTARAEGNIHIGQLKINPFLSLSETFDDNIYSTSTDAKSDAITTITPGLRLNLPFRIHQADLEYYGVLTRYGKYSEENTTDHHANGSVNLNFGSQLNLKLSDQYAKGHEPRGSSSTGFIEVYQTNTASASAAYKLADRSKIQLDYAPSIWRFQTSNFRNRDEGLVSLYFYYRFLPKTSAFVEYDHKQVVFSQTALHLDNNVDSFLGGLTWEISERSKGTVKAGVIQKDFTTSSQGSYAGLTGSADVRHDFTDNTSMVLTAQRTVNETSLLGNRYFITTGSYAEVTHKLLHKLSGVVRASYGVDNYADPVTDPVTNLSTVRTDRTLLGGLGLKYAMKDWLEFTLDYNSRTRRSNIPVNDYKDHASIITVNISL